VAGFWWFLAVAAGEAQTRGLRGRVCSLFGCRGKIRKIKRKLFWLEVVVGVGVVLLVLYAK
jgi:hypothetical protein